MLATASLVIRFNFKLEPQAPSARSVVFALIFMYLQLQLEVELALFKLHEPDTSGMIQ
jgi:hypothetical protein